MFSASEHTRVPNLCPRVEVPRAQLPAGVFPLLVVACSLLCAGCCSCCSHPCNTRPASRLPQCQRPGASAGREVALLSHPEPLPGRFTPFLEEPSDRVVSQVGNRGLQGPGEPTFMVTAGDPKTWCSWAVFILVREKGLCCPLLAYMDGLCVNME